MYKGQVYDGSGRGDGLILGSFYDDQLVLLLNVRFSKFITGRRVRDDIDLVLQSSWSKIQ